MKVRLHQNSSAVALCSVHYIGVLGMFIVADPLLLPKNTLVEVEFVDNANHNGITKRYPAVVTKRSPNGVGLTFADIDKHRRQDLLKMLSTLTNANISV